MANITEAIKRLNKNSDFILLVEDFTIHSLLELTYQDGSYESKKEGIEARRTFKNYLYDIMTRNPKKENKE